MLKKRVCLFSYVPVTQSCPNERVESGLTPFLKLTSVYLLQERYVLSDICQFVCLLLSSIAPTAVNIFRWIFWMDAVGYVTNKNWLDIVVIRITFYTLGLRSGLQLPWQMFALSKSSCFTLICRRTYTSFKRFWRPIEQPANNAWVYHCRQWQTACYWVAHWRIHRCSTRRVHIQQSWSPSSYPYIQ